MRILQDQKAQDVLLNTYWRLGRKMLLKSIQPVIDRAEIVMPHDLRDMTTRLIIPGVISEYVEALWKNTGTSFAVKIVKQINSRKDDTTEIDYWDRIYTRYAAERSAKITGKILSTEAENINIIIDQYIASGEAEGLGAPQIARNIRRSLASDIIDMQRYEAERIARTEVIGASNSGSFEGAMSTGLQMTKFWMTSGLPHTRETHLYYQSLGEVSMDYEYATGLKYPGDATGSPEEIINCRCTHGFNTD